MHVRHETLTLVYISNDRPYCRPMHIMHMLRRQQQIQMPMVMDILLTFVL